MKKLVYLLSFLLIYACQDSPYNGFSEKGENLYYQRLSLGEGIRYHSDSCFLDYHLEVSKLSDSYGKIKKDVKFARIPSSILSDSILIDLRAGDRIKIITSSEHYLKDLCKLDKSDDSTTFLIDFYVDEVYNLFVQDEDPNVLEFKEIENFIHYNSQPGTFSYEEGIWMRKIGDSQSEKNCEGELILDYKGYSLKGDAWDIPDFPLKFHMEDNYQVIRGIEIALNHMSFQDSCEVIIPSYLAFGEMGSKNGNIPPFRALYYQLKVFHPDSIQFIPGAVQQE